MAGRVIGEFGAAVREVKRRDGDEPDVVIFYGERFLVADEVGVMPLMELADAAASGLDTADMQGLAAMSAMIRDCLADGEYDRFRAVAKRHKADGDVLLAVCNALYEAISARPTESPSDFSDGRPGTGTSPSSSSSSTRLAALGMVPVDEIAPAELRAG